MVYNNGYLNIVICTENNFLLKPIYSKIGEEQSPEDLEDGPPELLVKIFLSCTLCGIDGIGRRLTFDFCTL